MVMTTTQMLGLWGAVALLCVIGIAVAGALLLPTRRRKADAPSDVVRG